MKAVRFKLATVSLVVAAALGFAATREADARVGTQALGFQGLGFQALGFQALGFQALGFQGTGTQALGFQGLGVQGLGFQATGTQALGFQALGFQALGFQALGFQGIGQQALGFQGLGMQSLGLQGLGLQALGFQGVGTQALGFQALGFQGLGRQALGFQGLGFQALGLQALGFQALGFQGLGFQGLGFQALGFQGLGSQALGFQGLGLEGTALRGIDRVGAVLADVQAGEVRLAQAQLTERGSLQWVRSGADLGLETVDDGILQDVHLQAGPNSDAGEDGSFICIPGAAGGCQNAKGTFWVLTLRSVVESDAPGNAPEDTNGLLLYIADVTQDSTLNESNNPDNSDIYLYTVYYRHPATAEWLSLCPNDIYGAPHAMAIPTNPFDRTPGARKKFSFACTSGGVAAKCARIWGYKPWGQIDGIDLKPFYDACLIAARADYCQNGTSFTRAGTTVDLFDSVGGVDSLVPTAGLAYEPGSSGIMLHEEYQISVEKTVEQLMSEQKLQSLSEQDRAVVQRLQASGLESSRYPDLDPGRSCLASPFIDRCDPKEPYACYRSTNQPAAQYGNFIAVNSPRFCSHNEDTLGEALDPMCNQCVTRVCQVDPTCCGDSGTNDYPGSLLWDEHCIEVRQQVCKSGPTDQPDLLWPPGHTAEPAGSRPETLPRGPIGSFEGILEAPDGLYAEGWACDPDHPEASIPVQLTLGAEELGMEPLVEGSNLITAVADQQLVSTWQELVGVECGGGSRHGFKVRLPDGVAQGTNVYAYGIDLDVPGAPFTLLRGGKKTIPEDDPEPSTSGALWTGWLEASETGSYGFSVNAENGDLYRAWVNGWLVAADDGYDEMMSANPGTPMPLESVRLLKGVTYGVRVELSGNQPDSHLELLYKTPSGSDLAPIPTEYLYPLTEHAGNGLRGEYFLDGHFDTPAGDTQVEPVDHVWAEPPEFHSVRWTGQVMPPSSGVYTFTAESDGAVEISIEGESVTLSNARPPLDPETCPHDICEAGAAIPKTCKQGSFCAARVCQTDPFCCLVTWDARCVERVKPACAETCSAAEPRQVYLSGGVKYDIQVDYSHAGGGATMRLLWGMPGVRAQVIPQERLFAEVDGVEPLGAGTGLNATWFVPDPEGILDDFTLESVNATLPTPSYARNVPPTAKLEYGVICGDPQDPENDAAWCSPGVAPAPPVILTPKSGALIADTQLTLEGMGAVTRGAGGQLTGRVEIAEKNGSVLAETVPDSTGGFHVTFDLGLGEHTLVARSVVDELESVDSWPVEVTMVEPQDEQAPAALAVLAPTDGMLSESALVPFSVQGQAGATLSVRRVHGEDSAGLPLGALDSVGRASGTLTLDYGATRLGFVQAVAGHASPEASVTVRVRPPAVQVSLSSSQDESGLNFDVVGHGTAGLGPVYAADGDGVYFGRMATFPINGDGTFGGSLTLDWGQHLLKFFQSVDGVDGDMAPIELWVEPPGGAVEIDSVAWPGKALQVPPSEPIPPQVTLNGHGLERTGLRSTVTLEQGNRIVGSATVEDDGNWSVLARLDPGAQTLRARQVVPPLSGGEAAAVYSDPVLVYVRPPAPIITSPKTGATLALAPLEVKVAALPQATVTVYADGADPRAAVSNPQVAGEFIATFSELAGGTHQLVARQALPDVDQLLGDEGYDSAPVIFSLGDNTPPELTVLPPEVTYTVEPDSDGVLSPQGAAVDFAGNVSATDDVDGSVGVTCQPASGSVFPFGTSVVACTATDAASNVGRTSFLVTVKSSAKPYIVAPDITVEAEGPNGTAVDYAVAAWGNVADCSPSGSGEIQPCARWAPANSGLGFTPRALAADPNQPGTAYALVSDGYPESGKVLRTTDGGESWQEISELALWPPRTDALAALASTRPMQILVARGQPGTLYLPYYGGVYKSTDRGETWKSCFAPSTDPQDVTVHPWDVVGGSINELAPEHVVIWGGGTSLAGSPAPFALRTEDGGLSWTPLSLVSAGAYAEGEVPLYITEDPTSSALPRFYMSTDLTTGSVGIRLYRKDGIGPWVRLDVPPAQAAPDAPARSIQIFASATEGNPPTIITSTTVSRDGGNTFVDAPVPLLSAAVRDSFNANRFWAATAEGLTFLEFEPTCPGCAETPKWATAKGVPLVDVAMDVGTSGALPTLYAREPLAGVSRSRFTMDPDCQDWNCLKLTWDRMQLADLDLEEGQVHDVAVDPVNPAVAYVLKYSDGIFRTTDGASTWSSIRSGFDSTPGAGAEGDLSSSARQLVIDPFHRNVVYAGGAFLWKSPDFGTDWTKLGGLPFQGADNGALTADPYEPSAVYWAPWNHDRVWRGKTSAVGVTTWNPAGPVVCEPLNVALNETGTGSPSALVDSAGTADAAEQELLDGHTAYADEAHGVALATGGKHELSVDFGKTVTLNALTVWHHPDDATVGHNLPSNVALDYWSGEAWRPISSFTRSYDLAHDLALGSSDSYEDQYAFAPVRGSKVRWSFDGDGKNVLGAVNDAVSVSAGRSHTCAALRTGQVVCWGDASYGQLGTAFGDSSIPELVSGVNDAVDVSAAVGHSCALRANGQVVCWGRGLAGRTRLAEPSPPPAPVPGLTDAVSLAAGGSQCVMTAGLDLLCDGFACAARKTGEVVCWGSGGAGQLGNGTSVSSSTPVTVSGLADAVSVSAGGNHVCALREPGGVVCWGRGAYGQLGDGNIYDSSTPVPVAGLSDAVSLSAGAAHTCAARRNGGVLCWGYGEDGELGDDSLQSSTTPVAVQGLGGAAPDRAVSVAAGSGHTCATLDNGGGVCWGLGGSNQLGNGSAESSPTQVPVWGLADAVSITSGGEHTCALRKGGSVVCWGANPDGRLGFGGMFETLVPTPVWDLGTPPNDAVGVAGGEEHTCAVRAGGEVVCWGSGGVLGTGTPDGSLTPVSVASLSGAVGVAAGSYHTCAQLSGGTVACWGDNAYGQLGDGSTTPRLSAVPAWDLQDVVSLEAGAWHTCAVSGAQGEVFCWGDNTHGQLGDGTFESSSTRVQVMGAAEMPLTHAVSVVAGDTYSCALSDSGNVFCWGFLGPDPVGNYYDVPTWGTAVQLQGVDDTPYLSDVVSLAAGGTHACAIVSSGQVVCWGGDLRRQVGNNGGGTNARVPVWVSGVDDAVALALSREGSCALRQGGEVACWGDNAYGQLGDGSAYGYVAAPMSANPTPVLGLKDAVRLGSGAAHNCAVRQGGSVVCWGAGIALGNGVEEDSTVPTPVARFAQDPWHGWLYEVSVQGCEPTGKPLEVLAGSGQTLVDRTDAKTFVSRDGLGAWGTLGAGTSRVVVDRSTEPFTYYVGGAALGEDPKTLYRTTNLQSGPFAEVGHDERMAAFQRFALDPGGSGTMYAIGSGWTFMVSPDKGQSWYPDPLAPPGTYLTNLWISPVDGAVFATAMPSRYELSETESWWDPTQASPGTLWKRTTAGALPPGARVVESELRPTCTLEDATDAPLEPDPHPSITSGSMFPIGNTRIACTATDAFGNSQQTNFTITVQDTTPPTLTVPEDITTVATEPDGSTAVGFTVAAVDAVDGVMDVRASDVCVPPPGTFQVGSTPVTCTVSDTRGNTAKATFNVVVSTADETPLVPPLLSVPAHPVAEAASPSGATVTLNVTALGADGQTPLTPTCIRLSDQAAVDPAGSVFAIGTTSVTCAASENSLTTTKTFSVTVRDTTPPVLSVPADITGVAATGSWGATVSFEATASDAVDTQVQPTCSPAGGSVFAPGTTTVTCRASDQAGNRSEASFRVTVTDLGPPVLTLQDITASATDATGALVEEFDVGADDAVDGPRQVVCIPEEGAWFPLGDTLVACSATDSQGNEAHDTFTIHVIDDTPPFLTVPGPAPIVVEAVDCDGSPVEFDVTASDRVHGDDVSLECERSNPVGMAIPVVSGSIFPLGFSEVSCTAMDLSGNAATDSFEVEVRDTTPPALILPNGLELAAQSSEGARAVFSATATDAVSGTPPTGALPVACTPASGSMIPLGQTEVRCVTRDQAGNETRGSFSITVKQENTPPVLELADDLEVEATGPDGAAVTYAVDASDAEDGAIQPDCVPASGSTFPLGESVVDCTATDSGGLADSDSFIVRVVDTTPPEFLGAPDDVGAYATSTSGARVSYAAPTATDLVDGEVQVDCTPESGSQFAVNQTKVLCAAADSAGNQSEVSFVVWVTYEAPTDGSFFLWPLRPDGRTLFRIGRPVPVRFRLKGASASITNLVARLVVTKISDDLGADPVEAQSDENIDDTDMIFRYQRLLRFYRYRWRTRDETQGTYNLRVDLGDGVLHDVNVSLRRW